MKHRATIAVLLALLGLAALPGTAAARDCGSSCAITAQYRGQQFDNDGARRWRPPFQRGDSYSGSRVNERYAVQPGAGPRGNPLPDDRIWSIARSRVPGRIVNARLHGSAYSFRIISRRGSIVDVVVDRYTGRIVSVRGGP